MEESNQSFASFDNYYCCILSLPDLAVQICSQTPPVVVIDNQRSTHFILPTDRLWVMEHTMVIVSPLRRSVICSEHWAN